MELKLAGQSKARCVDLSDEMLLPKKRRKLNANHYNQLLTHYDHYRSTLHCFFKCANICSTFPISRSVGQLVRLSVSQSVTGTFRIRALLIIWPWLAHLLSFASLFAHNMTWPHEKRALKLVQLATHSGWLHSLETDARHTLAVHHTWQRGRSGSNVETKSTKHPYSSTKVKYQGWTLDKLTEVQVGSRLELKSTRERYISSQDSEQTSSTKMKSQGWTKDNFTEALLCSETVATGLVKIWRW